MTEVRLLGDNELDAWDAFVASHNLGTVYHTSSWRKVIEGAYKHKPLYLVIKGEDGAIVAGLPLFQIGGRILGKRLSCLPCAQHANPLVTGQEQYDALMKFVLGLLADNNLGYCELKTSEEFPFKGCRQGSLHEGFSTYLLSLDRPVPDILGTFHKSCIQRSIRKADRMGLRLITGDSLDDVRRFYGLYFQMRKQKGLLPQPYRFFEEIWKNLRQKDMVDILHAEQGGQVISTVLLVKYRDRVTYEYGASRPDKMSLNPSNFLLWEAIKRSKEAGYKIFDFGRTGDGNQGLALYKSRWGTTRLNLYYHYLPHVSGASRMRYSGVMNRLMHIAIKSSPDFLCDMAGRMIFQRLA